MNVPHKLKMAVANGALGVKKLQKGKTSLAKNLEVLKIFNSKPTL